MSKIKRVKNLEDLLDLILEAALSHKECHELLRSHGDTASIMAAARSLENQGNLANLERDITDGLVDLSKAAFDQRRYDRIFNRSGLVLADEPERRDGHERRE
jgi:hypothetical protein